MIIVCECGALMSSWFIFFGFRPSYFFFLGLSLPAVEAKEEANPHQQKQWHRDSSTTGFCGH